MKITEVITFCHELDLLEAHLEEHKNFVNRTVIRESAVTYSYVEKPLYFKENESRFSRFNIEYQEVPVDYFNKIPVSHDPKDHSIWHMARRDNRERSKRWQWDDLKKGADYVFVMDTDEFICEDKYPTLEKEALSNGEVFIVLKLMGFHFFVNGRCSSKKEYRIVKADQDTHYRIRGTKRGGTNKTVGWHFSNCFLTPEEHKLKITGLCHSLGMSPSQVPSVEEIRNRLNNLIEPTMNTPLNWAAILSNTNLSYQPKFIQQHPEKFPWYTKKTYPSNSAPDTIKESEFSVPEE